MNHTDSAKKYLENVTGVEIKSDKVHLYNVEAKDMLKWLTEFAQSEAQQFAEWKRDNGWRLFNYDNYYQEQEVDSVKLFNQHPKTFAELYNGPYAKWKEERGK